MLKCCSVFLLALSLAGCGLFKPTYESCEEAPGYAEAADLPGLQVPEGADRPDARNQLKIPDLTAPQKPADGRCIDAPPSYRQG